MGLYNLLLNSINEINLFSISGFKGSLPLCIVVFSSYEVSNDEYLFKFLIQSLIVVRGILNFNTTSFIVLDFAYLAILIFDFMVCNLTPFLLFIEGFSSSD